MLHNTTTKAPQLPKNTKRMVQEKRYLNLARSESSPYLLGGPLRYSSCRSYPKCMWSSLVQSAFSFKYTTKNLI